MSPPEQVGKDKKSIRQEGQTSRTMNGSLLVNVPGLTDESMKGREKGQALGGQTSGCQLILQCQRDGKETEADGDQMVRKSPALGMHSTSLYSAGPGPQ